MNEAIKKLIDDYENARTSIEDENFLKLYFTTADGKNDPEFIKWKMYFLALDDTGKPEYEIPDSFFDDLDQRTKIQTNSYSHWYQIAASIVFLLVGVLAGYSINNWDSGTKATNSVNELNELRYVVMGAADRSSNANERIHAARKAMDFVDSENPEIIIQLLAYSLNTDPNIHVRLAAAESLFAFISNELAALAVIQSLHVNQDPLVQWQLIQMIRYLDNPAAIPVIQELIYANQSPDFIQNELNELWSSLTTGKTVNI